MDMACATHNIIEYSDNMIIQLDMRKTESPLLIHLKHVKL